jgi:hypothetical protein
VTNRIGLKNQWMNTTWNKDPKPAAAPKQPAKKEGWYQNSYAAQGDKTAKWSGGWGTGGGTSDLFRPTPGKPNFLTNLLGKLPAWEKKGEFQVGTAQVVHEGSFKGLGGLAQGQGRISFLEAAVHGSGSVGFKDGALTAKGQVGASATLVDMEGRIKLGKGDYGLDASGSAFVGAKANAHGELVIDPKNGIYAARVGGEAFAGARAGAEANVNLGKFGSVGGRAEAWAGVGAAFHAEAGFKNGRFKARFDIGAALGIGFKFGFNVDINVKGIVGAIKAPFKAIASGVKNAVSTVSNAVKNVASTVSNAAKSVGNFFKKWF